MGKNARAGAHHVHQRHVRRNQPQHVDHLMRHRGILRQPMAKRGQLVDLRQFAIQQQIGHFVESGMRGQFVDPIAAIRQSAGDRADRRFAGDDSFQTRAIKIFGHARGLRLEA